MDRRSFLAAAAAGGNGLATASAEAARTRRPLLIGETSPFCYRGPDGQPAGPAWEMVQELAQDLPQLSLQPALRPFVRAFAELDAGGPALIIPPARLPEREALLQWLAPLVPVRLMLFARADSTHDIATLERARALSEIGILNAPGLEEAYRAAGLTRVRRLSSNEKVINMLVHERLPAVLTADCSVWAALKEAGLPRSTVREGAVLSSTTLWLAASKNYPAAEAVQWQAAAQKRKAALAAILARYV